MKAADSGRVHVQRGFVLLELAIAGVIMLLFAIWGAGAWKREMQVAGVNAHYVWMEGLQAAAQRYLWRYNERLTSDASAAILAEEGYADWRSPSISELKADGLLSRGYPEKGPMKTEARIRLGTDPGCQSDCPLQALIHGVLWREGKSLKQGGQALVSQWLLAAKGQGGYVSLEYPQLVRGPAFSWQNPPDENSQILPQGTVALLATGSAAGRDFLRVRDQRNPDFQGAMNVNGNIRTEGTLS